MLYCCLPRNKVRIIYTDTKLFQKHFYELTDKCNNVTEMLKLCGNKG